MVSSFLIVTVDLILHHQKPESSDRLLSAATSFYIGSQALSLPVAGEGQEDGI